MAKKLTYEELEQRVKELEREAAERNRAEEALRESEDKYRLISENTSDFISIATFSLDPTYTYISPSHRALGYDPEDLLGKSGLDFIHPDDRKELLPLLARYVAKNAINLRTGKDADLSEKIEYRFRDKSGNWRYIESTANIIQDKLLLFVSRDITERRQTAEALQKARDQLGERVEERTAELSRANLTLKQEIAERKRVEEALRESEERHRTLFEDSRDAVYITTRGGNFVNVNQSFFDLFGCSREEIRDLRAQDFYVNPDDRHQFQGEIEQNGSVRDFEVKLRKKDGAEMYCLITATVRQAEDGDILGYQGIIRDITEHKRTDEALQESEEKYRSILESMEEGYFEVDLAGNLTFFNDAMCRIAGFPRNELMGMNNREYTTPETAERMYRIFNKVYRTGKPANVMDHEIITKAGRTVVLEMSASLMRDSAGEPIGFRGVVRDVTERKRAEEERKKLEAQLMQAQKMEAIGAIAGGVAHNFRNILTVISMNSQILQQRYHDDPTLQGIADVLNSYVDRGAQLVNGLTQFSRKQTEEQFQPLNLAGVIRETYELISKSFDKMIDISIDIPESLPILGDHAGLTQALMNLCTNARDAMPGGGELHIEASRKRGKALVVISDTGHGMDKETREKCFDPFFTTKELNKGTGLGLSTSYGIVKEHGGEIRVYSEIGKGTTFKLSFPLDVSGKRGKQEPSVEISRGKGQRILVVDDEIAVCKAIKHLLKGFGYHVAYARSGKAAIAEYKSWQPAAVLLDRNMPEMDGISCAAKIMDYDPNAKIVIISGYDEHGTFALDEEGKRLIKGYLTKPIDMTELSTLLARLLE